MSFHQEITLPASPHLGWLDAYLHRNSGRQAGDRDREGQNTLRRSR